MAPLNLTKSQINVLPPFFPFPFLFFSFSYNGILEVVEVWSLQEVMVSYSSSDNTCFAECFVFLKNTTQVVVNFALCNQWLKGFF